MTLKWWITFLLQDQHCIHSIRSSLIYWQPWYCTKISKHSI